MGTAEKLASYRSVLACARLRFSPQTQPIRDAAIDRMVEQALVSYGSGRSAHASDLHKSSLLAIAGSSCALTLADIQHSLERLDHAKRVSAQGTRPMYQYRLTEAAAREVAGATREADRRIERTTSKLFGAEMAGNRTYGSAFLDCLSIIFAKLGEAYVRVLKGDLIPDRIARFPVVRNAILATLKRHGGIEPETFTHAVLRFFREPDPEYNLVKWNLAQSYYIAKAIGLDPTGAILSRDVFGDSVLFLDTNVLINGLGEGAPHFSNIQFLHRACVKLGIQVKVCRISIDEMRHVVAGMRDVFPRVAQQVPSKTLPKIRDHLFHMYVEQIDPAAASISIKCSRTIWILRRFCRASLESTL